MGLRESHQGQVLIMQVSSPQGYSTVSLTKIKESLEILASFFLRSIIKHEKDNAILQSAVSAFAYKTSITHIASRISRKNLLHRFVVLDGYPPLAKHLH